MSKITKKSIREAIRPIYMKGQPGKVHTGYVWNPQLVILRFCHVPGRDDSPFSWCGNMGEAVDVLYRKLNA